MIRLICVAQLFLWCTKLGNVHGFFSFIFFRLLDNSLTIAFTSLKYLGMTSLKSIQRGNVMIASNKDLCYVDSIEFQQFFRRSRNKRQRAVVQRNKPLLNCGEQNIIYVTTVVFFLFIETNWHRIFMRIIFVQFQRMQCVVYGVPRKVVGDQDIKTVLKRTHILAIL